MEYYVLNLKENNPTVEEAMANLEIEIESAKKFKVKGFKIIHGYGSHGVGGSIRIAVQRYLISAKKQKIVKDFIYGADFNLSNKTAFNFITSCPDASYDEDFNHCNMGITIIIL